MASRYPHVDRNYCLIAAGKSLGDSRVKAKDCFCNVSTQEKLEVLQKQLGFVDQKNFGPERKGAEYFGAFTEIESCLMRPKETQFQCIENEVKNTVYNSYWNRPLGKSRDPTPGLPPGMNIYCTTFGRATKHDYRADEIIYPKKTQEEVLYEDKICHDLYKYSHQNYYPGERIKRNYLPPFNNNQTFGAPSQADHSGSKVRKSIAWFNSDSISNVSRRQAAVRERTSAPIGQQLDRTGVSHMFDVNYTFGKPTKLDCYGVEDLLSEGPPSALRRDMKEYLSYANKLRRKVHSLIKGGDLMLEELYDEFLNLDQSKTCSLHFDCIVQICKKNMIYLDRSKLEPLLLILGILKPDGIIQYRDFLDFLDLNKDFPALKREHYILPPEYQSYDKNHGSKLPELNCKCEIYYNRPAGVPTEAIDKTLPLYADSRVNMCHLGSETTARALISPSLYTQYGLSHRDFFKPRSKEFLSQLFKKIGCTLSDEDENEIYTEGAELDKTGGVCVETFRNLLDDKAYKTYHRLL